MKIEVFEAGQGADFADAVRTAQRSATRKRRPKERPALPRAKAEREPRSKLSFAAAQRAGWQFAFVYGRGHYAFHPDGRRIGYESTRKDLLDALWETGER